MIYDIRTYTILFNKLLFDMIIIPGTFERIKCMLVY